MGNVDKEDVDLLDFFSNNKDDSQTSIRYPTAEAHNNLSTPASLVSRQPQVSNPTPGVETSARRSGQASSSSTGYKASPRTPLADFTEAYSGLRVRNRLLSAEDMRLRMKGRKVHRLTELRTVPIRTLESQDPSDAWAVLGVLVSKSTRRQAANGGSYVIWTLSDLSRKDNDVSVFLFQEALSSHWTTCEGTLVSILSAKALPPKGDAGGGKNDQRLALSVDTPWQVSKVGMAMDYGICKGKRKDGKPCSMPVNKAQGGGFCEFHVVAAFNRAQRQDSLQKPSKGGRGGTNSTGLDGLRAKLQLGTGPGRLSATAAAARQATLMSVTPRGIPSSSLSGVMGKASARRDGVCATRFGGNSQASLRGPDREAKALLPSKVRAAGRTTMLSSSTAVSAMKTSPCPSNNRENQQRKAASTPCRVGQAKLATGAERQGRSSKGNKRKDDPLGLSWTHGESNESGESTPGKKRAKTDAASAMTRKLVHEGVNGAETVSRGEKRDGEWSAARGQRDCNKGCEGQGALDARPPAEAHPAGYMDGSVAVPAESKVFMTMPRRFGVRADGSRTTEGVKELQESLMLRKQQLVKQHAVARGILLRPTDPNSSTLVGKSKKDGGKNIRSRSSANAVIRAGKGAGRGVADPLAKKIKTMSAEEKELLLRRVSKYAGLAEEERAKESDRRMQRLEQRENMAEKAEEVIKMAVTVFHCQECKIRRSHFSKRCRDLGHQQKGIKATLRFFECTNCRRRKSCTERVPQTGCEFCGKHEWKRCGARPGRGHAEDSRDKRFVAAMSEWTDQRDLSLAAADFR